MTAIASHLPEAHTHARAQAAGRRDADRKTQELIEDLSTALRRCSFLLNSTRLVIADDHARALAGEAVAQANTVLRRVA